MTKNLEEENLLNLVKLKLGISSNVRDLLLQHIINSTIDELEEKGINIYFNDINSETSSFIVDYSCFKYRNTGYEGVPRYLQYRLHNLIIKAAIND